MGLGILVLPSQKKVRVLLVKSQILIAKFITFFNELFYSFVASLLNLIP
jgi:hypothetical protein